MLHFSSCTILFAMKHWLRDRVRVHRNHMHYAVASVGQSYHENENTRIYTEPQIYTCIHNHKSRYMHRIRKGIDSLQKSMYISGRAICHTAANMHT